ncbi:MAG: hypothetical protein LQ342_003954 [Letrouitia transgressa]|nr:MAG: hypothetical protein LQ342_003954 [Letrouitia transgressa]
MATRPLKAHELQGALSIHLEDKNIDFEKRKSIGGLEELLGPLVELHLDGSVNFIHPTARDTTNACDEEIVVLTALQRANNSVEDIRMNIADQVNEDSIPYLLSRISQVRTILEELSPQQKKDLPLVTEAYGKSLFKCPKIHCPRFVRGFSTRKQRDQHLRFHERSFKCTEQSCDYLTIGFPTKAELTRHTEICHVKPSDDYNFPQIKSASLESALNNAIDKNDELAVRELCTKLSGHPAKNGFLFRAVKRKSFDAAFILLDCLGSDEIHYKSKGNRTVLHEIVDKMHLGLLEKVLTTNIDVDAEDSAGRTALTIALQHKSFDAIKLLCNRAKQSRLVNDYQKRKTWKTAFIAAASGGHNDVVQEIFTTLIRDAEPPQGNALAYAARRGDDQTVLRLLESGADINYYEDGFVYNALGAAAKYGKLSMVRLLIARGANVNTQFGFYGTALTMASIEGHDDIVQMLLDNGADINAQDKHNSTALINASIKGHDDIVQMLLNNGADVNAQGGYDGTALINASWRGHDNTVQILLDMGADINAQTRNNSTALIRASEKGYKNIVQMLLGNGADVNVQDRSVGTALTCASERGFCDIVQMLLDNKADVNAQLGCRDSPLIRASFNGHSNVVEVLLDNGADVNVQCNFGSALQMALSEGNDKVAQILRARGAVERTCYGTPELQSGNEVSFEDPPEFDIDSFLVNFTGAGEGLSEPANNN